MRIGELSRPTGVATRLLQAILDLEDVGSAELLATCSRDVAQRLCAELVAIEARIRLPEQEPGHHSRLPLPDRAPVAAGGRILTRTRAPPAAPIRHQGRRSGRVDLWC